MRKIVTIARHALRDTIADDVLTFAAAIAFYTAFSLPPLLVVLVWILGNIGDGAEDYLRKEASLLIGPDGGRLVDSILENSEESVALNSISGWIGLGALLFASSGVFAQLQWALNRMWGVRARQSSGWWPWVRARLLSIGLIGVFAFLAAVSLTASTLLNATGLFDAPRTMVRVGHFAATIVLFTALFAAVFKLLPDVLMQWRDVLGGAFLTALLFALAKFGIGFYIAQWGVGSAYGAAGSAIVVLVWVYLSGVVLLVGAEITQAWVRASGRRVRPSRHAEAIGDRDGAVDATAA